MTDISAIKADTPVANPPTKWDVLQSTVGNLARPTVLYASGISSAVLTVIVGLHPAHWLEGAALVGAAWGGTAALYWGKSIETVGVAKAQGPAQ